MSDTEFSKIPNIPALPAVVRAPDDTVPVRVSAEMQSLTEQAKAAVDFLTRTPEGEATHRSASVTQAGGTTIPRVFAALASMINDSAPPLARTTSRNVGRTV